MTDISINNIHTFLNYEGKALSSEEETFLNTIFNDVDKEDKDGKVVGNNEGDGFLNNNEWSQFKSALKSGYQAIYDKLTSYINKTNDNIKYDYFASNMTFDPDMYSIDILKKKFPEDKYKIEQYEKHNYLNSNCIAVYDKISNKLVLKMENYGGSVYINTEQKSTEYDSYGKIYKEKNNQTEELTEYFFSAEDIYKRISGNGKVEDYRNDFLSYRCESDIEYNYEEDGSYTKTDLKSGIRTYYDTEGIETNKQIVPVEELAPIIKHQKTKEDLLILLNSVLNDTNAIQTFGNTHNNNLITNLIWEYCDNDEESETNIKKIQDLCFTQAKTEGLYINDLNDKKSGYNFAKLLARYNSPQGDLKIEPITKDTKIEQGLTGDCWLLEKIIGLTQTEEGLNILNSMYKPIKNSQGNITSVKVNVCGKEYNIPIDEINGANEFSSGNFFVRAIEIGVFKYLEELGVEHTMGVQDREFLFRNMGGGNSSMGSEIILDNGVEIVQQGSVKVVADKTKSVDDDFIEEMFNVQNALISVSTSKEGYKAFVMETGEQEDIVSHHAYSVVKKDDEYIYLIEPSDNKKTLRMTCDEFKNCFEKGDITPIKQPQKNDEKVFTQSGAIYTSFSNDEYQQMSNNPDKKQEIINNAEEKLKAELQNRFDSSKYDVHVLYNGRYFEYNILPKQR